VLVFIDEVAFGFVFVAPLAAVVCAYAGAAHIATTIAPLNTYLFIESSSVMEKAFARRIPTGFR
jgi:hypothetical protein